MADKIDRKLVQVYAGNSPTSDVQTKDGLPTKDVSELQDTNFLQGLRPFLTADGIMSSFESGWNAALYVLSNQIKYATDRGISEYDPDTEYFKGDYARIVAGGSIYTSKTNNNIGNPLSDIDHWQPDMNGTVPIGSEVGIYLPDADISTYYPNWLLARGQEVSRTTYPLLFQYLGTTFGAGDGSTTFNLPDTKDKFSVGTGNEYSIGDTGGAKEVALTEAQNGTHGHSVSGNTNTTGNHTHILYSDLNNSIGAGQVQAASQGIANYLSLNTPIASAGNHNHTVTGTAANSGSGDPHENRPPYIAKSFIIRAY